MEASTGGISIPHNSSRCWLWRREDHEEANTPFTTVARRVAVRRKRTYSRKELGRTFESLHAAGGYIGTYRRFHLLVETFGRLGRVLAGGTVRPEIEFSFVHMDGRVRENHLAPDRETAGVIGMDVRDQDSVTSSGFSNLGAMRALAASLSPEI